ncbi:peroxide stress protein YaaA [Marivirga harenae]|mgnify:CR=1 FL=1|uniref:peroxide stress protein YaaA n=1 Tax=Marivirga harenae TaxID=2010992 RepID=UPI0026DEEF6A|nr:peroxide stress protein YaaA [Marivirga harenae]WKV11134.1 peroxide stress protein YaaA [Marivirga harenae]|tara:strand:+ start:30126 stop:30893 length:768 start_codon:yes stop_codon:yes gene_type:complete
MIAILSPAKSLDFEKQFDLRSTKTRFNEETHQLIEVLKTKSEEEVQDLMSISDSLAKLNVERYDNFKKRTPKHAKQAALAFQGDVYQGLVAEDFTQEEHDFAQQHIRILSGLYGLLRPLDLIQPYRLEMGTKLETDKGNNLYEFWGDKITDQLRKDIKSQGDKILVNLASNEYFKSVNIKELKKDYQIIDVEFKDFNNGKYKIVSFFAKKARGLMARYIVKNQIGKVEDLKAFDLDGYAFDEKDSTDSKLAFKRG